ncbi:hypothetical protein HJC23_009993 [Cyclotella cryptica]|uniref:Serine aminopeptidase S33 domain-containing protein n=1 Tax=Cyclotella cryptica TaxID=29204 RepID=A0ABD3Q995_9STRA|eukprot:CCRYP_007760-RA/>CCRYP_007760-RA protein AED:0.45 eAED:0.45 QI:0/-1/0/1/-1/1/1/0/432
MSCSFEVLNNLVFVPNAGSDKSIGVESKWAEGNTITSFSHEISLLSALSFIALMFLVGLWVIRWTLSRKIVTSRVAPGNFARSQAISTALLLILACEVPVFLSTPNEGLVDLIQGTDPLLNEILARVPSIRQGPSPPIFLRNRHIQFIPWLIQNEIHRLQGIPFQRQYVDVSDCASKVDECHSPQMNDTITLDIFPPFDSDEYANDFNRSSPVILFAPGLRCHSQDLPGNSIIRKAFGAGFRSIVVNRRGHTPNQRLKSPRWNLFGDVDDLEQVYWFLKNNLVTNDTAFFLHGISSGTAVTVTALSKWDRRRMEEPDRKTPTVLASVAVTPGYDISKVFRRDRFLWPYNDFLMQGVKDHFVVQNEGLLREYNNDAVDKILEATNLQEIVDAGVQFAGYDNSSLYYQHLNPINELRDISTPKLVLNAVDDVSI